MKFAIAMLTVVFLSGCTTYHAKKATEDYCGSSQGKKGLLNYTINQSIEPNEMKIRCVDDEI